PLLPIYSISHFSFQVSGDHRDLHSFPTRRSSDLKPIPTNHPAFEEAEKNVRERITRLMSIKGSESVESFHKRLGKIMWDKCGMRSEEHTSELQSRENLVCRLLLEKKKKKEKKIIK